MDQDARVFRTPGVRLAGRLVPSMAGGMALWQPQSTTGLRGSNRAVGMLVDHQQTVCWIWPAVLPSQEAERVLLRARGLST